MADESVCWWCERIALSFNVASDDRAVKVDCRPHTAGRNLPTVVFSNLKPPLEHLWEAVELEIGSKDGENRNSCRTLFRPYETLLPLAQHLELKRRERHHYHNSGIGEGTKLKTESRLTQAHESQREKKQKTGNKKKKSIVVKPVSCLF